MSRLLQRLGCLVDTAANGQSAMEMIVAASEAMASPVGYDIVFLDNQMVGTILLTSFRDHSFHRSNWFVLFRSPSCPVWRLSGN